MVKKLKKFLMKKNCKKQITKNNQRNPQIIHLIVRLTKKRLRIKFRLTKMCYYFPKPFIDYWGNINAKVDLSNYATKTDIQNIWHANPSSIVPKTNLLLSIPNMLQKKNGN